MAAARAARAARGAALGLSGALSQGLFRNPLADPGLLGVTSGAVCAVALVLTVFAAAASGLPPPWRPWVLPLAAPGSVAGLLLTGLALNALAMAVVGLCTFIASDEQLRSLSFWTLGSLAGATWTVAGVLLAAVGLALWHGRRLAAALNALALGEASAAHVGVDVPRLRRGLVFAVALLSALAVAWCGLIGFIGLMAPVALPAEVPVGILTALIGAPAFLLLLRGVARRQGGQP
ncbi:iron chelate uptake ABC transporter family permease subunit [Piscinibacter sakaiensis]|uniref:FecCD family ABC transporter permease n=1 Tax=Piscinibacter sakaiensis TaxID=1547922 RepID=UPI0037261F61